MLIIENCLVRLQNCCIPWRLELDFSTTILNTIKEGKIVPSEVTVSLIQKEMESSDSKKFLIDGFPRSEENRAAFERIVSIPPSRLICDIG